MKTPHLNLVSVAKVIDAIRDHLAHSEDSREWWTQFAMMLAALDDECDIQTAKKIAQIERLMQAITSGKAHVVAMEIVEHKREDDDGKVTRH